MRYSSLVDLVGSLIGRWVLDVGIRPAMMF